MVKRRLQPLERGAFVRVLSDFESSLDTIAQALASPDAQALTQSAQALQLLCQRLAQDVRRLPTDLEFDEALTQHARRLAARMTTLREQLARRQAHVTQALGILIPKAANAGYDVGLTSSASRRFGAGVARQSGEFQSFNA